MITDAQKAAKLGPVIPLHSVDKQGACSCQKQDCASPGKHPRTRNGLKDATRDPDQITQWWRIWPAANIGLTTGRNAGVWVLDIDGPRGEESLAELESKIGTLSTRMHTTGSGGRHYLFAYPGGCEIRNKQHLFPGIDVRGEGGYIVYPPSVHASGKAYAIANDIPPQPAPEALLQVVAGKSRPGTHPPDKPDKTARNVDYQYNLSDLSGLSGGIATKNVNPQQHQTFPDFDRDIMLRVAAYLETCEPAIQGAGGHSTLLATARKIVDGFDLDAPTAKDALWTFYNPRCLPPWPEEQRRDFERKVDEVLKAPGQMPRGHLLEAMAPPVASANVDIAALLANDAAKKNQTPILAEKEPEPAPMEIPAHLLNPPGLVGEIVSEINRTALCPQPLLAIGCTLVTMGSVVGRKVRDIRNNRTNLYGMGVARSSAGKDHAPDYCQRLLHAAGMSDTVLSMLTGDSALETALGTNPVRIMFRDEIGHMMAGIKATVGADPHLATLVPAFMTLYSSAHKQWIGKQRAHHETTMIDQPCFSLWGDTTPEKFYRGVSDAEVQDGWLGRVMIFHSYTKPRMREGWQFEDVDEALVDEVRSWGKKYLNMPQPGEDLLSVQKAKQITYPDSSGAARVFREFSAELYERQEKANEHGCPTEYLWGKAGQNAMRVALILAACDGAEGADIEEQHAKYGCDLARFNVEQFAAALDQHAGHTELEETAQRLLRSIKRGPVPHSVLLKRSKMLSRDFCAIMDTLMQRGEVELVLEMSSSRPTKVYKCC